MKIRDRKKTSIEWASLNPILPLGAEGVDITTNKVKIGNGITAWNDLPYISGNQNYRGVFTSLNELENSITLPKEGDVADIDTEGTDIVRYVWDITDEKWVPQKTSVMNVDKASSADVIAGTDDINYMTVERTIEAISLNTSGNSDKLENKVTGTSIGDIVVQGDKYIRQGTNTIYSPSELTTTVSVNSGIFGIDSGIISNGTLILVCIQGAYYDGSRYNPFTVEFSVSVNSIGSSVTIQNVLKSDINIPFKIYRLTGVSRIKAVFELSSSFGYLRINVSSVNSNNTLITPLYWTVTDSIDDYTEITPSQVRSLINNTEIGTAAFKNTGTSEGDVVLQGDRIIRKGVNVMYSPNDYVSYDNTITSGVWGFVTTMGSNGTRYDIEIKGIHFNGSVYEPFSVRFGVGYNSGSYSVHRVIRSGSTVSLKLYRNDTTPNIFKAVFNISSSFRIVICSISTLVVNATTAPSDTLTWDTTSSIDGYTELVPSLVKTSMYLGDFGFGDAAPTQSDLNPTTIYGRLTSYETTATNKPSSNAGYVLTMGKNDNQNGALFAIDDTGEAFTRAKKGSYTSWKELVNTTSAQTLFNKTLTGLKEVISDLGNVSGTVNIDCAQGNLFKMTLNGNITGFTFSNAVTGSSQTVALMISTGSYSVNFSGINIAANHSLPTLGSSGWNLVPLVVFGNNDVWL